MSGCSKIKMAMVYTLSTKSKINTNSSRLLQQENYVISCNKTCNLDSKNTSPSASIPGLLNCMHRGVLIPPHFMFDDNQNHISTQSDVSIKSSLKNVQCY